MKATIKDVAKLANVSIGTVSMAVNNKRGINQETKEKVMKAVRKLNYSPNQCARSLITSRSSVVGLVVTDITNPFFGNIVSIVQKRLEKEGYGLQIGVSNDKVINEKKAIENLISRNIEGLLIVPPHDAELDLSHLYHLERIDVPFVYITTFYKSIKADCIMTDLSCGSYELTKYLIKRGNRKIYHITGSKDLILSSSRIDGYMKAYEDSDLEFRSDWIVESYPDFINCYAATKNIINNDRPDAIITINDMMAFGALKCLKDNKIKVPDEVSVAGYDDLFFSSIVETPLTTVRQPVELICERAIEILLARIKGDKNEKVSVLLKPDLVIRSSTR